MLSYSVEDLVDLVGSEPFERERAVSFVKVGSLCVFVFSVTNVITFFSFRKFWNTFKISEDMPGKMIFVMYYLVKQIAACYIKMKRTNINFLPEVAMFRTSTPLTQMM